MSKKLEEFQRVNADGLVNVVDEAAVNRIPLFYCHGKWYGPAGGGRFSVYKDTQAGALLGQHGFNRTIKNEHGNSQAEITLLWLMQNHSVNYAGPLAGYPVGLHPCGSQNILVTEALTLPEPKAGKWPTIQLLAQSLFEDENHDQISVVYSWLATSLKHLRNRMTDPTIPFSHCPALVIFGSIGGGKSAFLDLIIAPLFGGRTANPFGYLKEGKFNKDLFSAAFLVMDDKGASSNLDARRERGDALKSLIWTEIQRMEGKGADALQLAPFWRLIIAGNFEESSMNVSPALNNSLKDKLIFCKTGQGEGLPENEEQKAVWIKKIRAELPAFAHFLSKFKPHKKYTLDKRSHVINFWHPEIVSALLEKQPECKALEVIDLLNIAPWKGTATEFYAQVCDMDKGGHWERLFSNPDKCGRMLTELAKSMPERVVKTTPQGISRYEIYCK